MAVLADEGYRVGEEPTTTTAKKRGPTLLSVSCELVLKLALAPSGV